mmetsp:Transcript_114111/g.310052  ORF Transcript_114111/g.310052 Transcript_114111/m.310052 type:complete len:200 (-) Transcript_114111:594-1193(-)
MAGLVIASLSRRSPMAKRVMCLPSLPARGELFTEHLTDSTGGSIGVHSMQGTLAFETSVCVHLGMKPVTLTETMSPAMAFLIGSLVTPVTTVTSFTFPLATTSPSRLLAMILSPFCTQPLKTFPVTVGPNAGSLSSCETSMEKPPIFSSAARISGSTSGGDGAGTCFTRASYRATMSVGRLSDRASSRDLAQKPALPEA